MSDSRQIEIALQGYTEPHLGRSLADAGAVKAIQSEGGKTRIDIELGFPCERYKPTLAGALGDHLKQQGVADAQIEIGWRIKARAVQQGLKPKEGIKNIVAVASGKGGVGKSTVAVNLALALAAEGASVGVLDADIYGPSQPRMLGTDAQPEILGERRMAPLRAHGLKAMSVGFLVDASQPTIWRGPMVTSALQQLLNDTDWAHDGQELDYLIVDLPPGTGDIQLTLAQKVPVSGSIIVTTPQDIALLDARKGLEMFRKVNVPVLGVVENMATHICSACGHEEAVFGAGGGQRLAEATGMTLLGQLPLDLRIREQADGGKPSVAAEPDGEIAAAFFETARRAAALLSLQKKDYAAKMPKVVVEDA